MQAVFETKTIPKWAKFLSIIMCDVYNRRMQLNNPFHLFMSATTPHKYSMISAAAKLSKQSPATPPVCSNQTNFFKRDEI